MSIFRNWEGPGIHSGPCLLTRQKERGVVCVNIGPEVISAVTFLEATTVGWSLFPLQIQGHASLLTRYVGFSPVEWPVPCIWCSGKLYH